MKNADIFQFETILKQVQHRFRINATIGEVRITNIDQ
jgi:hypothetical protein